MEMIDQIFGTADVIFAVLHLRVHFGIDIFSPEIHE